MPDGTDPEERGRAMTVCRIIALLFALAGLAALGGDLWAWQGTGSWRPQALGQLWFALDRESLNISQAAIQRHLHPFLWNDVIRPMLLWPVWIPPFAVALVLYAICRIRRRHRI